MENLRRQISLHLPATHYLERVRENGNTNSCKLHRDAPFALVGGAASNAAELDAVLKRSAAEAKDKQMSRQVAASLIRQQLNADLHLQGVLGDGSCLFRALSRSYHDVTGELLDHAQLRQKCVARIATDPELFVRFDTIDERDAYLSRMKQDAIYGDELCLRALTRELNVRILVYTPQYGTQTFMLESTPEWRTVRLAYNGIDHYDVVLRRNTQSYVSFNSRGQNQQCPAQDTRALDAQSSEQSGAAAECITILSANVTSWTPHADQLLEAGADILLLQETRLSASGIAAQQKLLASRAWDSLWGKPPGAIKVKTQVLAPSLWQVCAWGGRYLRQDHHTFDRHWS